MQPRILSWSVAALTAKKDVATNPIDRQTKDNFLRVSDEISFFNIKQSC